MRNRVVPVHTSPVLAAYLNSRLKTPPIRAGDESQVAQRATNIPTTCRVSADQADCIGMEQDSVQTGRTGRKPYQYRLLPTPKQERALDTIVLRCRPL